MIDERAVLAAAAFGACGVDKGGHLAGWEQPQQLFSEKVRASFKSLR
jgi:hypothetical protein